MSKANPGADPAAGPRQFEVRGQRLILRPLTPADAGRLQEFFYSHTLETIQLRYGHAVARMTNERAHDLVSVDQSRDLALAIVEEDDARQTIHAIGRYYLDTDGRGAEAAFVVRESCRRRGLGTRLLQALVATARQRGLAVLWGRVRHDNQPMLALFRRFGGRPVALPDSDSGDLEMRIPLQEPVPSAAPAPEKRIPRTARPRGGLLRKRKSR